MVTKIKGKAQFNIGQVEVPIIYDSDATAYLAAVPTAFAAMSYAKRKATNDYFKALKTNGLWSKITQSYLPVFGQVEGGVNLKTPAQNITFPASGAVATYSANGILFAQGWQATSITITWNEFHGGFYNAIPGPDTGSHVSIGRSSTGYHIGRRVNTGYSGILTASSKRAAVQNHVTSIGAIIASHSTTVPVLRAVVDGEYAEISDPVAQTGSGSPYLGTYGASSTAAAGVPHAFFTFGTPMTQQELSIYNSLVTTLMTAILI